MALYITPNIWMSGIYSDFKLGSDSQLIKKKREFSFGGNAGGDTPPKTNVTMAKNNHVKMYFLSKVVIFQPAILVFIGE